MLSLPPFPVDKSVVDTEVFGDSGDLSVDGIVVTSASILFMKNAF